MRKTNLFGATFLALTASAWSLTATAQTAAPAPAAPMAAPAEPAAPMAAPAPDAGAAPTSTSASPAPMKKHMSHHMMHGHGKLAATPAGNAAVEDLNAASLDAAKSGKPFVAPTTPSAAKKVAHMGGHKMHHMSKPKGDATAPTAPADTSGK